MKKFPLPYRAKYLGLMLASLAFIVSDLLVFHGRLSLVGWFFGLCFLIFAFSPVLERRHQQKMSDNKQYIVSDQQQISHFIAGEPAQILSWQELDKVELQITSQGPYLDDVFWCLGNIRQDKTIVVSNNTQGMPELLTQLQALPGFDNYKLLQAMADTSDTRYRLWKKVPSPIR